MTSAVDDWLNIDVNSVVVELPVAPAGPKPAPPIDKPALTPPKEDAGEPRMTILKRDPSAPALGFKTEAAGRKEPEKSLVQREKEYQAAKDRIFNESKKPVSKKGK